MNAGGWFEAVPDGDRDRAVQAVRSGGAEQPGDWPALAVAEGFADEEAAYYEFLHEITVEAARREVAHLERAEDKQLVHLVRAMDDLAETSNRLAERAAEWAASVYGEPREGHGYVHEVADRSPSSPIEAAVIDFAATVRALDRRRESLETDIERQAEAVAPNLTGLAGPGLAARLIALAGGLESLAKKPSGTVQVLGAEDALFAHLEGHAPSPKHGIIYTHEYVRGTPEEKRGSAARALAGKLSIAARIDHYRGEVHQPLQEDLDVRIEQIRTGGDQ
ncbi:MAG: NOP5/NOP56 family protein [Halodesulfurarchaeum sp.]